MRAHRPRVAFVTELRYRRRAIDGSCFELPDEADNAQTLLRKPLMEAFGYPGSRTSVAGHAGYPQARCAVLVECATHAILGANVGPYRSPRSCGPRAAPTFTGACFASTEA